MVHAAWAFEQWSELPLALQHAVAAATLIRTDQPIRQGQQDQAKADGSSASSSHADDTGSHEEAGEQGSEASSSTWGPGAAARATCRALKEGVDAAATGLQVQLPNTQRHWRLGLGRFPKLARLEVQAIDPHWARYKRGPFVPSQPAPQLIPKACRRVAVHLGDAPPRLQELCVSSEGPVLKICQLPQVLPHLRVMKLEAETVLPEVLDCSHFPSLQHLVLRNCEGVQQLVGLASCTGLRHLELISIHSLTELVDGAALAQLPHLEVLCTKGVRGSYFSQLDVTRLAPSLKRLHLEYGPGPTQPPVQLFLPDGLTPRTALTHLHLHRVPVQLDLRAVPNLVDLSLSGLIGFPGHLDLTPVPQLTRLAVADLGLHELDVSPVWDTLVQLNCCCDPVQELDLSGATALQNLTIWGCRELHTLTLPAADSPLLKISTHNCDSLSRLDLSGCPSLRDLDLGSSSVTEVDLSAATALNQLDLQSCSNLGQLDLSACISLQCLNLPRYDGALKEVDVSACQQLRYVCVLEDVRLVGVHSGVKVETYEELWAEMNDDDDSGFYDGEDMELDDGDV